MSSGPHLNIRRAAMRPAGRGLDIPGLDGILVQAEVVRSRNCPDGYCTGRSFPGGSYPDGSCTGGSFHNGC